VNKNGIRFQFYYVVVVSMIRLVFTYIHTVSIRKMSMKVISNNIIRKAETIAPKIVSIMNAS